MNEIRWVCTVLFGVVSLCIISGNWWIALRRGGSLVPLIGGVLGILALFIAPSSALNRWWWSPAMIDVGSAPLLAWTVLWASWQVVKRRSRRDTGDPTP
jgi:hypothetical protein